MSTRPLLVDSPQTHVGEAVDELKELREELSDLHQEFDEFRTRMEVNQLQLAKLLHGFRSLLNGEVKAEPAATEPGQPISSIAYSAWKQRLSPACGKIIDALLVQPLNATQLKKMCGIGYSTVTASLGILRANALLEKQGDRYSLKRL